MYSSALAKFAGYLEEGFSGEIGADIEGVLSDVSINPTEKLELVKARIGQGIFRQKLLLHWECCAVTGYAEINMLVASLKPWSASSNTERLGPSMACYSSPTLTARLIEGLSALTRRAHLSFRPCYPMQEMWNHCRLSHSTASRASALYGLSQGTRLPLKLTHHQLRLVIHPVAPANPPGAGRRPSPKLPPPRRSPARG